MIRHILDVVGLILFEHGLNIIVFFECHPLSLNVFCYLYPYIANMPSFIFIACNFLLTFWVTNDKSKLTCMFSYPISLFSLTKTFLSSTSAINATYINSQACLVFTGSW